MRAFFFTFTALLISACGAPGATCATDADCKSGGVCVFQGPVNRKVCTHTCTMQSECFDVSECVMCKPVAGGGANQCVIEPSNC